MPKLTIDLEPVGRRTEIESGATLLEAAQAAGVELLATCGGQGACFDCRVRLARGQAEPPTLEEQAALTPAELAAGQRLACQCIPTSHVKVDIPPESLSTPQRLSIEGQMVDVEVDPILLPLDLTISPPLMTDLRPDSTRLLAAVNQAGTHLSRRLLVDLSERLRRYNWQVRLALRGSEIVAVLPHQTPLLGLAVDIGTTKVAAYLVDLANGATLAKSGAMNPQIGYGEDVISRIHYANTHADGRRILQTKIVETLNSLITELTIQARVSVDSVVEAVIVGNTAMHHLLAGLPVEQLGASPYVPAAGEPLEFPAAEIGLKISPGGYIYLPPNIAGYVGADHVAMAIAADVHTTSQKVLALDIGTNTEISLAVDGKLYSCSCASGPAFEGAHIRDGMRAAPGAIEKVSLGETIKIATIDHRPAVGICGSGILDAIGELVKVGALDKRGNLRPEHPLVRVREGKREFVLAPAAESGHGQDVLLSRSDINEIQLAKGAIRAGEEVLLAEAGIKAEDLDEFIVAGAFGTYLDLASAMRVGMFPTLPLEKFRQIGNAAGAGARQMLISRKKRLEALQFSQHSRYVELTLHRQFMASFTEGMMLG